MNVSRAPLWHGGWLVVACVLAATMPSLPGAGPYTPETADPLLDAWRWQRFTELNDTTPQCMFEGPDGEMWFGLGQGAMRYDGVEWKRYGAAEGLPVTVHTFHRARDGMFYAGTETGIFRFARHRWERFYPVDPSAKLRVTALASTSDGALWACGAKYLFRAKGAERVFYVHPGQDEKQQASFPTAKILPFPDGRRESTIANMLEDRDGMLWCYTVNGPILRYNPKASQPESEWRLFDKAQGYRPTPGKYGPMRQLSDGTIWVAARPNHQAAGGINQYNPATNKWSYIDLNAILATDALVKSIVETSDGAVWLGGQDKLMRYKDGNWSVYRAPEVPLSSSRFDLLESRTGDLWVLSANDEVQRIDFRGQRWLKYKGLNFRCETPDGRQWFLAADDGVVCFDGKDWSRFGTSDGLMAKPCALYCTRKGELWAAGSHEDGAAAIARFDGATWTHVPVERSKLKHAVAIDYRAIAETPDGSLWFGSYEGARHVRRKNGFVPLGGIIQYDPTKGAPHDEQAWTLHVSPRGGYQGTFCSFGFAVGKNGHLFSGYYANAAHYDGHRWRNWLEEGIAVDAICNSSTGDVWFGTQGQGVYKFTGAKKMINYTVADGLGNNAITTLFSDRDDHLWVGSGKGISRFDGKEWITDAFPAERVTMGTEGGGFGQSRDGALWINQSSRDWMRRTLPGGELLPKTIENFWTVRFRPDRAAPVTKITTALEKVSQPGNAVVTWRAVDPWWKTSAAELRYSFRLDGGAWSKFSPATSHVLLELPVGRHTFEVRARDGDLNAETTPARIEFEVLPPIWRQPWFLTLLTVLTTAIAAQTWRVLRRDRLLHQANGDLRKEIDERSKIAAELEENKWDLEDEIEERKRMEVEIEKTHKQLLLASHQAGMAEVATSVLHNVGNVLNSINVSATIAADNMKQLQPEKIAKTAELLAEHASVANYLTSEKGKLIPNFLRSLSTRFGTIQHASMKELEWLRQNVEHVKEIVAMQQAYSSVTGITEKVKISELIEDSIRMNAGGFIRHQVAIERDFRDDPEIEVEKHKVLQILVNLLHNAKYACDESGRTDKKIVVRIERAAENRVAIAVIDNGVGIPPENMTRIFNHGFTTRKDGHGFGLHSAANTATTLAAKLTAHSDGPGRGATFVLDLPLACGTAKNGRHPPRLDNGAGTGGDAAAFAAQR